MSATILKTLNESTANHVHPVNIRCQDSAQSLSCWLMWSEVHLRYFAISFEIDTPDSFEGNVSELLSADSDPVINGEIVFIDGKKHIANILGDSEDDYVGDFECIDDVDSENQESTKRVLERG